MKKLREKLAGIAGGRVLDFGGGDGRTVRLLRENLASFDKITSIDIKDPAECVAEDLLELDDVEWRQVDGGPLPFADESLDTVCISCTLHHLKPEKIQETLADIRRVLRPGGIYILVEMFQDDQAPPQLSQVAYHHFIGELDRLQGIDHHPTLLRRDIARLAEELELRNVEMFECRDEWKDPKSPEDIANIFQRLDEELARLAGNGAYERLCRRAEEIKKQIRENGFLYATRLVVIGKK